MIPQSTTETHHKPSGVYLKDLVYGAIDGTVTTFAIIAGVTGASLSPAIILILGFGNLIADGFSMAVSNFLSIKAERDFVARKRKREEWEVKTVPEEERREIKALFAQKGFKGDILERATEIITSNKKQWVDMMVKEELSLTESSTDPKKHALATLLAFVIAGFIPLIAFVLSYFIEYFREHAFAISAVLTSVSFFAIGAAKTWFTKKNWFLEGVITLIIGGLAALMAYFIGAFLKNIIG